MAIDGHCTDGTCIADAGPGDNPQEPFMRRDHALRLARRTASLLALAACAPLTWAHGDVTPQAVDTQGLAPLGAQWRDTNPYRQQEAAVKIGTSGYNANCARCHGIDAVSGGIAPDLRKLDNECVTLKDPKKKEACVKEVDNFFSSTVRHGRTRNGAVYMPPFEGVISQEAVWAIKAYLETRREKPL